MTPTVVAVVLNWCGEELTTRCLRSLSASTYPGLEILLVDNGSPDGSGERLRSAFSELAFLQTGANLGYAGGNNLGIEWALSRRADHVLVLNNDTVVEPDAVARLVRTMEEAGADVAALAPKILRLDEPDRIWYAGGRFSPLRGVGVHWHENEADDRPAGAPVDVTFVTGCCCLLSAEALRAVGGFEDGLFAYLEDADLSLRLLAHGKRLLYEPRARIFHDVPPRGTPPTPFQIRQRDRNRLWIMRRHFSLPSRLPFLIRFYASRVVLLVRYLLLRDFGRAGAILSGTVRGSRATG